MVPENMKKPYEFELFHPSSREPLDLYSWGNDFFRPLVELDRSKLAGMDNLKKIAEYLEKGENVFLMSNHQVTRRTRHRSMWWRFSVLVSAVLLMLVVADAVT